MCKIEIATATECDLSELIKIEISAQVIPWSKNMLQGSLAGKHICWKMVLDTEIVGYLIVMRAMEQLELLNIVVSPLQQGRGFASLLMRQLEQFAKENQITSTFLEVRQSNHSAICLYQKFAFEQVGVRKNYYPCEQGREDALVMQLTF